MRVIAGSARRLNLVTPKGMDTRPTGDKIKETLFNILSPYLYGIDFLDLYAGSGGIGIEALSRGAAGAVFIEKNKEAVSCIKKNLATTHFEDRADVICSDVCAALYNLTPKRAYGIVFMDPPYGQGLEQPTLSVLANSKIIDEDTLIIVESNTDTDFTFAQKLGFDVTRIKRYKNNMHVFMRLSKGDAPKETE